MTTAAAAPSSAQTTASFIVESPTMLTGVLMPRDYSPDGRNVSPPLTWRGLPEGTRQIAVLCQDHGAGRPPPWVHWIIYNIPGNATGLPEGVPFDPSERMPDEIAGATQGNNGWGLPMYLGPRRPGHHSTTITSPCSHWIRSSIYHPDSPETSCSRRSKAMSSGWAAWYRCTKGSPPATALSFRPDSRGLR